MGFIVEAHYCGGAHWDAGRRALVRITDASESLVPKEWGRGGFFLKERIFGRMALE